MGTENITEYNLAQHHGSACFYRHGLMRSVVMSEGAHFLCENGAGWLMDAIVSYQFDEKAKACDTQIWKLKVNQQDNSAVLTCLDGDVYEPREIIKQEIPFTDFPLPEIELRCTNNGEGRTIYLPQED